MNRIFTFIIFGVLFVLFMFLSVSATQTDNEALNGRSSTAPLSYSGSYFYVYGVPCGENCDKYGRNCAKGICNAKDCNVQKGYTEITTARDFNSYVVCSNPTTKMSYSVYSNTQYNFTEFFVNKTHCGENCDIDGNNCSWGVCNVMSCDRANGYTELKIGKDHLICHKPNSNLSYFPSHRKSKIFYYNGDKCGDNCDTDGRNCTYESGSSPRIGICNPVDCPNGYEPYAGLCKKIGGKTLLYKDKDGKFKNEDVRAKVFGAKMGAGFAAWLLTGAKD